ncbi:Brix domain-containing protein [Lineolata rhizophorae]|uniref:Ribosome production factor 2 homolog n=1 Tax=Lineolata rhizophorae TaxID=578093 RepID=A0A6A6P7J3_9PEZI|nr:Brix domain-containing protein [Lineolata rhizophorae]
MQREAKPRNARSKRALAKKEPQVHENPKTALFLRGTSCSQVVQLALADLNSLKRPLAIKFTKKNDIHPFEDASSLEFFSEKNDTSLTVFGHHSKKRPHCLVFARFFEHKVLDMLELYLDPDSFRTISQFRNKKCAVGLKPMIAFSGTPFESPTPNAYTLAKSIFVDFFRGQETSSMDVEGLQYLIHFSAGEESDGQPQPPIHFRVYLIRTSRSGQKLPRIDVEEMGPRMDFRVGRMREADQAMMKEALKKPKSLKPKAKKNIETDIIGDKMGRIHVGKQDLKGLQTRKMKGLKRSRDVLDEDIPMVDADVNGSGRSKKERV